jgi:biopolymer transport protein ExbD
MKNSYALGVAMSAVLTLITGCGPLKPTRFKVVVPEGAEESSLTIIWVTIDEESRLFVNKESAGTTEDLKPLKEKVTQALERRRQYYRARDEKGLPGPESESALGVVFVRAPSSAIKSGEVVKVVDVIKEVGGGPVGLSTQP